MDNLVEPKTSPPSLPAHGPVYELPQPVTNCQSRFILSFILPYASTSPGTDRLTPINHQT